MDEPSTYVQYTNNRFKGVGDGYTLSYINEHNSLVLKDAQGSIVFNTRLDDIASIYKTGNIFLQLKFKDGTSHFLSFGTVWDPIPGSRAGANVVDYNETIKLWTNFFRQKGITIKMPPSMIFMYVCLGLAAISTLLIIVLRIVVAK
jgi:hypothetical protein